LSKLRAWNGFKGEQVWKILGMPRISNVRRPEKAVTYLELEKRTWEKFGLNQSLAVLKIEI
jgi:hypothetical protein